MSRSITRRRFLQSTAAATVATTIPALGATTSPATQIQKLNLGMIGLGGQGTWHLGIIKPLEQANIVALCDVDTTLLDAAAKKVPSATTFGDFRDLLKMPGLDAVLIATPDHSHAYITAAALRAGKHVYCEKPLTRTIREARAIVDLAAQTRLVTQMGIQVHAFDNYRRVVEVIQSNAIGPVHEVHIWNERTNRPVDSSENESLRATFNYDLWLGPVSMRPLLKGYHPYNWRRWWAFGSALLGDIGCHFMDIAFWALELEHATRISAEGPLVSDTITPEWNTARYEFPARGSHPPVTLHWYDPPKKPAAHASWPLDEKLKSEGVMFIGDEGMLCTDYEHHVLLPAEKFKDFKAPTTRLAHSPGHQREWIEACLKNDPSAVSAPFAYGALLTECAMLGTIAYRTGTTLEWDAKNLRFPNSPAAEKLLGYDYRAGWTI